MKEAKNILVPLDLSKDSKVILHYAVSLSKKLKAKATVFHVLEKPRVDLSEINFESGFLKDLRKHHEEEAERGLKALMPDEYRKENNIKTDIRWGEPSVEIINEAERMKTDLIIMGTHGRTGLSHMLLGSVAEKVLRLAPCPVTVVKNKKNRFEAGKSKDADNKNKFHLKKTAAGVS